MSGILPLFAFNAAVLSNMVRPAVLQVGTCHSAMIITTCRSSELLFQRSKLHALQSFFWTTIRHLSSKFSQAAHAVQKSWPVYRAPVRIAHVACCALHIRNPARAARVDFHYWADTQHLEVKQPGTRCAQQPHNRKRRYALQCEKGPCPVCASMVYAAQLPGCGRPIYNLNNCAAS